MSRGSEKSSQAQAQPHPPAAAAPPWEAELAAQALAEEHARQARLARAAAERHRAEQIELAAEFEAEVAAAEEELSDWERRPPISTPADISRTVEELVVPRRIRRSYWYAVAALLASGLFWWLWNGLAERIIRWLAQ